MDQDPKPQGTDEQAQPQGAVQGASLQTTDQQAGPKFRWWRLLVILLVGSGLAVATYMIAPSIAWSESASKEVLVDSQRQLQHAVSGQVRLAKDLARLRKEHATALENVEKWEVADKAGQAKLTAANESIAQMSEQLKEAQQAGEPLREKVAAAELALSEAKTEAEEAKGRSKELVAQLASAADSAKQLSGRHQVLLADNAKLKSGMQAGQTDAAKLRAEVAVLGRCRHARPGPVRLEQRPVGASGDAHHPLGACPLPGPADAVLRQGQGPDDTLGQGAYGPDG